MELVAWHGVPESKIPTDVRPAINFVRGAALYEMLHCLGVQHPTEEEHGPAAWLSQMARLVLRHSPMPPAATRSGLSARVSLLRLIAIAIVREPPGSETRFTISL